ncbi:MAG: hypothetical protein ACXWQO_18990, partial [Bdellovibrionota bacterium]
MVQRDSSVNGTANFLDTNSQPVATGFTAKAHSRRINIPLGLWLSERASIGLTVSFLHHQQILGLPGADEASAKSPHANAMGFILGGLYKTGERTRLGAWVRPSTKLYENSAYSERIGNSTVNYRADFSLYNPWIWAVGFAYEGFGTYSFYAETDLIGKTKDGYLLSYGTAYSSNKDADFVAKGRNYVVESHLGIRKTLSQKVTLHLGGYHEASRWENQSGRLHATGGVSLKIGKILELIVGGDIARNFNHVFVTFR